MTVIRRFNALTLKTKKMKEYIKLQGVVLNTYRYNISYLKRDLLHDYQQYNFRREMNKQKKISLKDFVSMKILYSCINYINNNKV